MSIRATIQDETAKIQEYIRNLALSIDLLSEYLRQQKHKDDEEEDSEEAKVFQTRQDPRCRQCKDAPETIQDITVMQDESRHGIYGTPQQWLA